MITSYWKKPWTAYAGIHAYAWFVLWVGSLSFLKVYLGPSGIAPTDAHFLWGLVLFIFGAVLLVRNYKK